MRKMGNWAKALGLEIEPTKSREFGFRRHAPVAWMLPDALSVDHLRIWKQVAARNARNR